MKELRLTDAELRALIAPALLDKLRCAGFATATAAGAAEPCAFYFPINLALAGEVTVNRSTEGVWTITQECDPLLAERTADTQTAHIEAMLSARPGDE